MKKEIVYTPKDSEEVRPFPYPDFEREIAEKYDYIIGYYPEGFNSIFLLVVDDPADSKNDVWKILFFNKMQSFNTEQTITLDNIDSLQGDSVNKFEIFKTQEATFEEVLNLSIDVIKKIRAASK